MSETNSFQRKLQHDIQLARMRFEGYEKLYAGLTGDGKKYLQKQSMKYKKALLDIQKLIIPSVQRNCPSCINCCKLDTPELSIYIAGSLGCFDFIDYILVRCDTVLPEPIFENMEHNLCAFWKNGCILPHDCRSFSCTKYFCDKLKQELDMRVISENIDIMRSILAGFSIKKCLSLEIYPQREGVYRTFIASN